MRLFVALEIPSDVRDNLAAFFNDMKNLPDKSAQKGVRWVRPESLHVTLKFIGEVEEVKLAGIHKALLDMRVDGPSDVHLRGLGFFPDQRRPAVLWTAVESTESLPALTREIDRTLATQDIAKENRVFVPHLTLARFSPPGIHPNLLATVQKNILRDFGSFEAREFLLIESTLKSSGAEYSSVQTYRFGAES
jgi:2'-5' RNA ligase